MKDFKLPIFGLMVLLIAGVSLAAAGKARIRSTEGNDLGGSVTLEDTKKGLKISATFKNVSPGKHGFHIHQFGDCGNMGKNAGGHYNPGKTKHGHLLNDGKKKAHMGDLGNVEIRKNWTGALDVVVPGLTLQGKKYSVAGRAFILHQKPDDFGQPTGNAGGRIGCAPILLTSE